MYDIAIDSWFRVTDGADRGPTIYPTTTTWKVRRSDETEFASEDVFAGTLAMSLGLLMDPLLRPVEDAPTRERMSFGVLGTLVIVARCFCNGVRRMCVRSIHFERLI